MVLNEASMRAMRNASSTRHLPDEPRRLIVANGYDHLARGLVDAELQRLVDATQERVDLSCH